MQPDQDNARYVLTWTRRVGESTAQAKTEERAREIVTWWLPYLEYGEAITVERAQ